MSNPDDAEPGLREDWHNHPFTQMMAKQLQKQEATNHANFLAACEKTTDPKVSAALATWKASAVYMVTLGGEKKRGQR